MSTFVLKWNPEISSFKYAQYLDLLTDPFNMYLDWSIHDWQKMNSGDRVFFLRVGEKPQLLASGYVTSDPCLGADWSGRDREVYYADFYFDIACHPDYEHVLTADALEKEIGDFDWRAGHSGVLLTEEQAEALELLWTGFLWKHQEDFCQEIRFIDDESRYEENDPDVTAEETESAAPDADEGDDETEEPEGREPFVGIIGYCGNSFEITYGSSAVVDKDSPLQKILTRRYGNDCRICGYNYQRIFDVSPDLSNTWLYIPDLKDADWKKTFVCVCRSCEEVLEDDKEQFLAVLKEKGQHNG